MTFTKSKLLDLIKNLLDDGINEISFKEIAIQMEEYYPNHNWDYSQLANRLSADKKLFLENGITIYNKTERRKELEKVYIKDALKYYSKELNRQTVEKKELYQYILDKYNYKFASSGNSIYINNIEEMMKDFNISFRSNSFQQKNSLAIIKDFASSKIVEEYKSQKKLFSLKEISDYLKNHITMGTVYNYTRELIELGVPINKNKLSENNFLSNEEVIEEICRFLISQKIEKILAGKFAFTAKHLSLPKLKANYIEEQKTYIYEKFGIEIIEYKNNKEKYKNEIKENLDFLTKENVFQIKYVNILPRKYDDKSEFIISKDVNKNLASLWDLFIENYLSQISINRINVRNDLFDKDNKIKINTESKEIFFLMHKDLNVSELTIEDIIKLSNKEVLSRDKLYGVHRQNMLIGFLMYLYSKKMLLVSFKYIYYNWYMPKKAQNELEMYIKDTSIYEIYKKFESQKRIYKIEKKYKRLFLFSLMSFSTNIKLREIEYKDFAEVELLIPERYHIIIKLFSKFGAVISFKTEEKVSYTKDYDKYKDNPKYSHFIAICSKFIEKNLKLGNSKTPKGHRKRVSSSVVAFLKFIDEYHPNLILTKDNLERVFDFPDSKLFTYQEYIERLELSKNTKKSKINVLLNIFRNTKDYEGVLSDNQIPEFESTSIPRGRTAIEDDEIIAKIDEIVTNRPPRSDYFYKYNIDMDDSWWPHMDRVIPFEPLIIKLHLRIPVRGATIRLTDRENVLNMNSNGDIKSFYFCSDKNKNRRDPLIIPNIWNSELEFIKKLVEFNKKYFPKLKRFFPDDTTLNKGVMPLFPSQDGSSAYTSTQHLLYWTKVLIQAEIEFKKEGKFFNLIYSTTISLPNTVEELDNLSSSEINTFKKRYDIHSLRHTGITRYIRAGMPLELVRMLSGHKGFNTILTIYYHVDQKKLIDGWLLKNGFDIAAELDMDKTTELFIKKEFIDEIESVNPEEILVILKKYGFFNLENRTTFNEEIVTLEMISKTDPKFWRARTGGICTKQRCPEGINEKCSLCPYFISNYMFLHDIGFAMQLSLSEVKKYSDLIVKNRELKRNEKNSRLKSIINIDIESFYGWLEVLKLADDSYKELINKSNDLSLSLIHNDESDSTYSIYPSLNVTHGHLDILLKADRKNLTNDEKVDDIINKVANNLIRYHAKNNTYHEIEGLENEQIIKSFLPKYEKISGGWYNNLETRKELENLLNLLDDKNEKLEYKNENTFLTE
jgi:hypothetical protein